MSATPAPEFSRVLRLDQIGRQGVTTIAADENERKALARRFRLASLDRLEAEYGLTGEESVIVARGQLRATLAQACVATGDSVPETVDAPFIIRFVREEQVSGEEETELDEDDCDTVFYAGDAIDIGEAVAETLALVMEPYPRSKDADAFLAAAGVKTEGEAGPFAALLALKGAKK